MVDLSSRPVRLIMALVALAIGIALFWEVLPPYGVGPPFDLPSVVVQVADVVALFVLASGSVAIVAALMGWAVDLDRTATRRWQGVTVMTLDFYLARYDHYLFAPDLDPVQREGLLAALQSIRARGDSAIFVLSDAGGYADRVIVMTRATTATMRERARAISGCDVSRASRGDRRELMQRYPGLGGTAWWISWD